LKKAKEWKEILSGSTKTLYAQSFAAKSGIALKPVTERWMARLVMASINLRSKALMSLLREFLNGQIYATRYLTARCAS
jgi:hypothetical protein